MIDPRGMRVEDWCNQTSLLLSKLGAMPVMRPGDDWKNWAFAVIEDPQVEVYMPPDPRNYDSWLEWAERFVQAVPL